MAVMKLATAIIFLGINTVINAVSMVVGIRMSGWYFWPILGFWVVGSQFKSLDFPRSYRATPARPAPLALTPSEPLLRDLVCA